MQLVFFFGFSPTIALYPVLYGNQYIFSFFTKCLDLERAPKRLSARCAPQFVGDFVRLREA